MKSLYQLLMIAVAASGLVACELDNYDGPDASISGTFLDVKDNTPVQQDIARGTQICFHELGFSDPETQYMIVKETGEYQNKMIFSGSYDFFFNESNFVIPEKIREYQIRPGENRLDFKVQPYIRVSDVKISRVDDDLVATFTITPTVESDVKTIGFFGHIDRVVGDAYALARTTQDVHVSSKDQPLTYILKLSTSKFKAGTQYYFRVGAVVNIAGAKYNYAPAVRIQL